MTSSQSKRQADPAAMWEAVNRDTGEVVASYATYAEVSDHCDRFPNDRIRRARTPAEEDAQDTLADRHYGGVTP